MNKDLWGRIDKLEELAENATPGPWVADKYDGVKIAYEPNLNDKEISGIWDSGRTFGFGCDDRFICDLNDGEYHQYRDEVEEIANGQFIAAANPAMILEIIAEMRKMWRQNNWDLAVLQAYGALPEDMEVSIENESFAWHLNRIKTGIRKRLEFTEKKLEDCLEIIKRLEKEADWLAEKACRCSESHTQVGYCHYMDDGCTDCLANRNMPRPQDFREAAKKAISEIDNN